MTNGISDFFESTLAPGNNTTPMATPNPYWQGHRVVDRDDLFPKGFSQVELDATYANLANDAHDLGLLLESPSLEELDYYNPGRDEIEEVYVLEAITVEHFSRTERRMAAVVRVLNRHLSDSEITALSPVVGKPKKSGSFAYVVVQLPFSDGQTVNVVFHSPEGDKKRIGPSDAIIAFRWLLNKRDITHVVAPEDGEEVSLETIAKRITQLVLKNSARFERQQKAAQAERKELDEAREAVKNLEEHQSDLIDQITAKAKEAESIEARLSNTLSLLEKQKTINAELQAKIDALRAQRGQNDAASPGGNATPTATSDTNATPHYAPDGTVDKDGVYIKHDGWWYTKGQDGQPKDRLGVSYQDRLEKEWRDSQEKATKGGSQAEPPFVSDLQDIIAGKYDADTEKVLTLLEAAIVTAEKDGSLEKYEAMLEEASDHLTDLLAKEAA